VTRNGEADDLTFSLEMVSPGRDFLLRRKVEAKPWLGVGQIKPAPGDDIVLKTKFPNHKLAGIVPGEEEGWQYEYYLAPLSNQQAYNWEFANGLSEEYDEVRLTYIVKRADYVPGAIAAPPALGGRTWTYMGERQVRRDARTDALFVETQHLYRDIVTARTGQELDVETGLVRPYSERMVAAGTAGQAVDTNGTAKEVRHINALWSLERTLQVAGLAGGGDGSSRTWSDVLNYSWPDVLLGFSWAVLPKVDGSIEKIVARPVWLREAYDGPCAATITETWTKNPPTPPLITPMQLAEVFFDGALMSIPRTRALHAAITLYEAPGSNHPELGNYLYQEFFPATSLTDWPATYVASFNVTPAFGGYLSKKVEITRPTGTLFANLLQLSGAPTTGTANGWTLNWERLNPVGTLTKYRVDINTKADFTGSFLTGWKNKDMATATTAAVTGMVLGVVYFVRVKATITAQPLAVSNTLLAASEAVVSMKVTSPEGEETDGGSLAFGIANPWAGTVVKTITLENTGNVTITGLAAQLSGTNADQWGVGVLGSTTLAPGASLMFDVTFDPTSLGSKTATLTIASANAADVAITLTGTGVQSVLQVQYPGTTPLAGNQLGFGSVSGYSTPTTNPKTITLKNTYSVPAYISSVDVPSFSAAFSYSGDLITGLPYTLPPGDSVSFVMTWDGVTDMPKVSMVFGGFSAIEGGNPTVETQS
jgi:hypothetical protein